MRCLLVDDDIPTLEALCHVINWENFGINEVQTANNIHDAKRVIQSGLPDLIICDIEMPRGSGLELIQWVRENEKDCGFIFFTCHESFEFASKAISFKVDSYLVKPLDQRKLEEALVKSIQQLKHRQKLDTYQRFGTSWLKNKNFLEKSFWRDVLTGFVTPRMDIIVSEVTKRELTVDTEKDYTIALVSVTRSQVTDTWDSNVFLFALSNLCSEILSQRVNHERVVAYQNDYAFYVSYVMSDHSNKEENIQYAELILTLCKQYFKSKATCYISEKGNIAQLKQMREELEHLDYSNIIFRGKVHLQKEPFQYNTNQYYEFDAEAYSMLFVRKEKVQIVNRLKKELEKLTELNKLDPQTLHAIREDFLQVAYSFLASNLLQAHRLFSDEHSQRLLHQSESSVFHFMKWAYALTDKTIEAVKASVQSESVIEKAKRYIIENYKTNLSREDVAASVYLTPDYLAKTFKSKTGLSIKEFLNEYRIKAAQRMLLESDESISYIAMETGFDNISYFSTVFKKITGETPNLYRSKYRSL